MEVVPFKLKYIRDIVGWIETESQMIQTYWNCQLMSIFQREWKSYG